MHNNNTTSAARALLWSFGSPSLVTSSSDARWQDDAWFAWRALELARVQDSPALIEKLDRFLAEEKDHRLGARFERLIEFGLMHLPDFECVQRRVQVYVEGQTRGEFDFIVRERASRALEHWEVACKFYLGVPSGGQLHWVGPGKRDSLVRKLRHLTERQLLLSESPDSRSARDTFDGEVSCVRAMIKGRLFYPLKYSAGHDQQFLFERPQGEITLNPRVPTGYWCDFDQLLAEKPASIRALAKPQWLDPGSQGEALEFDQLEADVHMSPQCIDVVTRDQQTQRWFVVRPGWFDDLIPPGV